MCSAVFLIDAHRAERHNGTNSNDMASNSRRALIFRP
jgi:hypothetical protein